MYTGLSTTVNTTELSVYEKQAALLLHFEEPLVNTPTSHCWTLNRQTLLVHFFSFHYLFGE